MQVVVVLLLVAVSFGGLSLAIINADSQTFWTNMGFLVSGSAIGAIIAIFVVNGVMSYRERQANDKTRRRLLRSIGHDAVGAIDRVYWGIGVAPQGGLTLKGHNLNTAWYYYIETGLLNPEGFKDEVYSQYGRAVHSGLTNDNPPESSVVLTNGHLDFDIGLLMVTRALGRAYARIDLFEPEDLPINDLEQAAQLLRDGKEVGTLDSFQSASLLAALTTAVERCGVLLCKLKGFVTRSQRKITD